MFAIERIDGKQFKASEPSDIYCIVVECVNGMDARNVSASVHSDAVSAECWAEDSEDDIYSGNNFIMWWEDEYR